MNPTQGGPMDKTRHTWLFVRLNNKTEAPQVNWITGVYSDLEYAKHSADYVKRQFGENCIILDQNFEVVYDTRAHNEHSRPKPEC